MRIATWNLKQAVGPKRPLADIWGWAERELAADVYVLTEAKVPVAATAVGWGHQATPGGVGAKRPWGTVLMSRPGIDLDPVEEVKKRWRTIPLEFHWPGVVQVADCYVDDDWWGTIVGLYGITENASYEKVGHGRRSTPLLMDQLRRLFTGERRGRIVVAGDFNLWPADMPEIFDEFGLVDLVAATREWRPELPNCSGCDLGDECGHMWTHRNTGGKNARVQQIDYVFASEELLDEVVAVEGGYADFPAADEYSDHAPIVVTFGASV
jgi:exonuclease III